MSSESRYTAVDLNEREIEILAAVIGEYIRRGEPIPSKLIAGKQEIELSSASVRKSMSRLEDLGYIVQPHTSAGRIPTDKGYRFYIDKLEGSLKIERNAAENIRNSLKSISGDIDTLLDEVPRILGMLSKEMGLALAREFEGGTLFRLRIIARSEHTFLIIMTIDPGIVKTAWIETRDAVSYTDVEDVIQFMNERLAGIKLREIRETFWVRMKDSDYFESPLIQAIGRNRRDLFRFSSSSQLHFFGTSYILSYPEFDVRDKILPVIRLLEEQKDFLNFLESQISEEKVSISVGRELPLEDIQNCSLITACYDTGSCSGIVGILGPMRMRYSRVIPIVEYTAKQIREILQLNSA
jgi:heat-inducible transcriptional repressor